MYVACYIYKNTFSFLIIFLLDDFARFVCFFYSSKPIEDKWFLKVFKRSCFHVDRTYGSERGGCVSGNKTKCVTWFVYLFDISICAIFHGQKSGNFHYI